MHLFKTRKGYRGAVAAVLVMALLLAATVGLLNSANRITKEEQNHALVRAIQNAVVSCYAIEGRYPATLEKIQQDYGIVIDEEKYFVDYNIFADNIMPIITVTAKGEN